MKKTTTQLDDATTATPKAVRHALSQVLEYLWDDEMEHFTADPSDDHVFAHLRVLKSWLDEEAG